MGVFDIRGTASMDMSKAERELSRFISKAERTNIKLKGPNARSFTQPLGRITGSVDEFTNSMEAANARVLAFGASAGVIYAVGRGLRSVADAAIEVERELTQLNSIFQLSSSSLQNFGNELFNVAKKTGAAFSDVAKAATEFSRMGLTAAEALKRTRDAMILTRLSGLEVEKSVMAITAALNTFNDVTLTSTVLINKMANVAASFAVSERDLAEAFRRVGSSAAAAGVSVDELMGIVTTAQVKTARGGAVIGNSLKTLFTRIQRPRVVEAFEALGIAVRDAHGEMLPAMTTMKNYAKAYQKLSTAQRAQTAELLGGVFQVNVLKAVMSDLVQQYNIYDRALGISISTTDEAIQRNDALSKTLSHLLNETAANAKKAGAALGEMTLSPTIKNVLGATNWILESLAKSAEKGDVGTKIGKGILEGIGKILSGPGLAMAGILIAKLTVQFAKFTGGAVMTITGMNAAAKEQAQLQKIVVDMMSKEPGLIAQAVKGQKEESAVIKHILSDIKLKNAQMLKTEQLAKRIAAAQRAAGFSGVRLRAEGHIPNFAVTPDEARAERSAAASAGYRAGSIKETNIPNYGRVVYNSRESVKKFPGFSQPAIMPPASSPAGANYAKAFGSAHGFNPYVPNFTSFAAWQKLNPSANLTTYKNAIANKQIGGYTRKAPAELGGKTFTAAELNSAKDKGLALRSGRLTARGKKGDSRPIRNIDKGLKYQMLTSINAPYNPRYDKSPVKTPRDGSERVKAYYPMGGFTGKDTPPTASFQAKTKEHLGRALKNLSNDFGLGVLFNDLKGIPSDNAGFGNKVMEKSNLKQTMGNMFDGLIRSTVLGSGDTKEKSNATFDIVNKNAISKLAGLNLFNAPAMASADALELKLNNSSEAHTSMREKLLKRFPPTRKKKKKGKAGGLIPNFAGGGGLGGAIVREMSAGVPISSIRVGSHPSLRSGGNPGGLAVTNTRDEGPSGSVSAGISRSKKAGINPKTHGMHGWGMIPSFAASFSPLSAKLTGGGALSSMFSIPDQKTARKALSELNAAYKRLSTEKDLEKSEVKRLKKQMGQNYGKMKKLGVSVNGYDQAIKQARTATAAVARADKKRAASSTAAAAGGGAGMMMPMMALMMMPMLTQSLSQFQDSSTKEGRVKKASIEGYGDAAMWAGMGGMLGPMGAVAGGAVGLIMRQNKVSKAATEQVTELTAQLERLKEESKELKAGISGVLGGMQTYRELLAKGGSGEQLQQAQQNIADSIDLIPDEHKQSMALAMASGDDAKMIALVAKIQKDVNTLVTTTQLKAAFAKDLESKRGLGQQVTGGKGGAGFTDYAAAFLGLDADKAKRTTTDWVWGVTKELAISAALGLATGGAGTVARVGMLGAKTVKAGAKVKKAIAAGKSTKKIDKLRKAERGARGAQGTIGSHYGRGWGTSYGAMAKYSAAYGAARGTKNYLNLMSDEENRVRTGGELFKGEEGKLKLKKYKEDQKKVLKFAGQTQSMTDAERAAMQKDMGAAKTPAQLLDAIQTHFKDADTDALAFMFEEMAKSTEQAAHDLPALVNTIKDLGTESLVSAQWADKSTKLVAVMNRLNNENLARQKAYNEAIKGVGIALSEAMTRFVSLQKTIAEMDLKKGGGSRKMQLQKLKGSVSLGEAFMDQERQRQIDFQVRDLELANKTILSLQKLSLKNQSSFLQTLSKRLVGVNDQINNLYIGQQATNKATSTADIVKIAKSSKQRDALMEIFREASSMFQEGSSPEQVEEHLRNLLVNNKQLNTIQGHQGLLQTQIIEQLKTAGAKDAEDRAKILQQHQLELAELRIGNEIQRKLNIQQGKLNILGGISDYASGSSIRPAMNAYGANTLKGRVLGGVGGQIEGGRASVNLIDTLQKAFSMSGQDMPSDLKAQAVSGHMFNLMQQAGDVLTRVPQLGLDKDGGQSLIAKLANNVDGAAQELAELQLAAEMKDPTVVLESIHGEIKDMKVTQALSLSSQESQTFRAFDSAIRGAKLHQVTDAVFDGSEAMSTVYSGGVKSLAGNDDEGRSRLHFKLEEIRRLLALEQTLKGEALAHQTEFEGKSGFLQWVAQHPGLKTSGNPAGAAWSVNKTAERVNRSRNAAGAKIGDAGFLGEVEGPESFRNLGDRMFKLQKIYKTVGRGRLDQSEAWQSKIKGAGGGKEGEDPYTLMESISNMGNEYWGTFAPQYKESRILNQQGGARARNIDYHRGAKNPNYRGDPGGGLHGGEFEFATGRTRAERTASQRQFAEPGKMEIDPTKPQWQKPSDGQRLQNIKKWMGLKEDEDIPSLANMADIIQGSDRKSWYKNYSDDQKIQFTKFFKILEEHSPTDQDSGMNYGNLAKILRRRAQLEVDTSQKKWRIGRDGMPGSGHGSTGYSVKDSGLTHRDFVQENPEALAWAKKSPENQKVLDDILQKNEVSGKGMHSFLAEIEKIMPALGYWKKAGKRLSDAEAVQTFKDADKFPDPAYRRQGALGETIWDLQKEAEEKLNMEWVNLEPPREGVGEQVRKQISQEQKNAWVAMYQKRNELVKELTERTAADTKHAENLNKQVALAIPLFKSHSDMFVAALDEWGNMVMLMQDPDMSRHINIQKDARKRAEKMRERAKAIAATPYGHDKTSTGWDKYQTTPLKLPSGEVLFPTLQGPGRQGEVSGDTWAAKQWGGAINQANPASRNISMKGHSSGEGLLSWLKDTGYSDKEGKISMLNKEGKSVFDKAEWGEGESMNLLLQETIRGHEDTLNFLYDDLQHKLDFYNKMQSEYQGMAADDPMKKMMEQGMFIALDSYNEAMAEWNNAEEKGLLAQAKGLMRLVKVIIGMTPETRDATVEKTYTQAIALAFGKAYSGKDATAKWIDPSTGLSHEDHTALQNKMGHKDPKVAESARAEYLKRLRDNKDKTTERAYENLTDPKTRALFDKEVEIEEMQFLEDSARDLANSIVDYEKLRKSSHTTGDALRTAAQQVTDIEIQRGSYGKSLDSAWRSMGSELRFTDSDFYKAVDNALKQTIATFRDGTIDAFDDAITGAKKMKESFKDIFQDMTDHLRKQIISMFVNRFIFEPIGAGMMNQSSGGMHRGGMVKGYARGGIVTGGQGGIDDVPATLNQGEYVIRQSEASKPGMYAFLSGLNSGNVLRAARGSRVGSVSESNRTEWLSSGQSQGISADTLGPDGTPVHGMRRWNVEGMRQNIGDLTGYALDSDNPQNQIRLDRESAYYGHQDKIAGSLEAYAQEYKAYMLQQKANRKSALWSAAMSLGSGWILGEDLFGDKFGGQDTALGKMGKQFGNAKDKFKNWATQNNKGRTGPSGYRLNTSPRQGGAFSHPSFPGNKLAEGGSARSVPSLLTDGEFVVNKGAVDSLGTGFFDRLNKGVLTAGMGGQVKRYAEGGIVDGGSSAIGSTSSGGEMINNVTVNVNMNGEGGTSTSVIGGPSMNDEQARGLGDLIQKQVVQTIIKEKRSGGILSRSA